MCVRFPGVQIEIDGVPVDPLPDLEGVLVLNIEYWSAGCRPWQVDLDSEDASHVHSRLTSQSHDAHEAQHTDTELEEAIATRQRRSEEREGSGGGAGACGAAATAWRPQRIDDGLVEVLGLRSVMHIGQLQTLSEVGLGDPLRLGQGRVVRIVLKQDGHTSALRRPQFPLQVK